MRRLPAIEDYPAIHARIDELRRDRNRVLAGEIRPEADAATQPGLLPAILEAIAKVRPT